MIETPENFTEEEWIDFDYQDDNIETSGTLEDEEITQIVKRRRLLFEKEDDSSDNDGDHEPPVIITRAEVNNALETVRSFLQMNAMQYTRITMQSVELAINSKFQSRQTQSSITRFFKPPSPASP